MCYDSVAQGAHGSRARASQALAGIHRTNYVAIQQVVKQSQPVSSTTFDKLGLSLTCLIRISTVMCYASPPHGTSDVRERQVWSFGAHGIMSREHGRRAGPRVVADRWLDQEGV